MVGVAPHVRAGARPAEGERVGTHTFVDDRTLAPSKVSIENAYRVLCAVTGGLGLLLLPAGTAAQDPTAEPAPAASFFGLSWAGELRPGAIDPRCGDSSERTEGVTMGGFVVLPARIVSLEVRFSHHWSSDASCPLPALEQYETRTDSTSAVGQGGFATLDLRLRWPVRSDGPWALSVGAGWAGSEKDVPYVTGSVDLRAGTGVRWGADLEAQSYRVPWTAETGEFVSGQLVQVVSADSYTAWATSFALRLVVEVPIVRQ